MSTRFRSAATRAAPLLLFLGFGGVVLAAEATLTEVGWIGRTPLVITASTQQRQLQEWQRRMGRAPTVTEQQQLIAETIEDEVLYREALRRRLDVDNPAVDQRLALLMRVMEGAGSDTPAAQEIPPLAARARSLGLAEGDLAVRRHLILQMRLLAGLAPAAVFTEAELQARLAQEPARYTRPATHDFTHHYVSTRRHGAAARARAGQALKALQNGSHPLPSDPWPTGLSLAGLDAAALDKDFGPGFADALAALPPGEWQGPLASTYGWHLLRVHAHHAAAALPLAAVRPQVQARLQQERAAAQLAEALPRLQRRYHVIVEPLPSAPWPQDAPNLRPETPDALD